MTEIAWFRFLKKRYPHSSERWVRNVAKAAAAKNLYPETQKSTISLFEKIKNHVLY